MTNDAWVFVTGTPNKVRVDFAKCPPAEANPGASHLPTVWMCRPCMPGGSPCTLTTTCIICPPPCAYSTKSAVPVTPFGPLISA